MKTKTRTLDDAQMIRDPDRWPAWPFLPLKRRDNSLESKNLAVLCADGKDTYTLYHVYLFDLPKSPEGWKNSPQTTYASIEALLQDGWIVD